MKAVVAVIVTVETVDGHEHKGAMMAMVVMVIVTVGDGNLFSSMSGLDRHIVPACDGKC